MSEESIENEEPSKIGVYEGGRNEKRERHGWGKAILPNGDMYEGNYTEGKRNGFGTYRFKKNRAQYAGNYIHGIRQGYGTMIYPDGSKFEGNFTLGQKNGYGKYTYVNKDFYEGEWKKDKRNGLGVYFHADTGTYYKGYWVNGQREGPAEVIFLNYKFLGVYKQNKPFGPGKFEFSNNSEANGAFMSKNADEKLEEEVEDEEDYWKNKETQWKTLRIDDLRKQPPPTMQELIDARLKVVKAEMYELDRALARKLKPEVKVDVELEESKSDTLAMRLGDVTSQLLRKMAVQTLIKDDDDEEEGEEEEEVSDEACVKPENPLAFTAQEVEKITTTQSENQPSAY